MVTDGSIDGGVTASSKVRRRAEAGAAGAHHLGLQRGQRRLALQVRPEPQL